MLKSLYICNYALISEINISFDKGFSVMTGETGAGKSIILGALSLILGQRAENKYIKNDAEKSIIEAEFDISSYRHLSRFFEDNDLDFTPSSCIIRRELSIGGKSRAFINDSPVSLSVLKDLSNRLIDIHSQHENLLLSNAGYQLDVVDTVAANTAIKLNYAEAYERWTSTVSQLVKLKKTIEKQREDLDYIQFQYQQLTDAKLQADEQLELEQEQDTLSNAEEIKSGLLKADSTIADEQAILMLLKESISAVSKIKSYIPQGDDWVTRLESTYIELKDISAAMSSCAEKMEFNPERLEWVENRLSELYSLQKKYKVDSIAKLIEKRNELEDQLQQIESFDDNLLKLENELRQAEEQLNKCSVRLTDSRKKACKPIRSYLVEQLVLLGMPNIQFEVVVRELSEFSVDGKDEIQFMFSANKNREMQPVALIASGGEIARVMLALKSMIVHKVDLPTIFFDEIDTGVSGEIAHRMGDIMRMMGDEMQVITITHLPQIAGKGVVHYKVYKDDTGNQTQTYIKQLNTEERVVELAQMLSGKNVTDAALQNAKDLLRN